MTREEAKEVIEDIIIDVRRTTAEEDKALRMAIEALQTEVVRCKDCTQKHIGGSVTQYYWCDFWDREVDCNNGCSWGMKGGNE